MPRRHASPRGCSLFTRQSSWLRSAHRITGGVSHCDENLQQRQKRYPTARPPHPRQSRPTATHQRLAPRVHWPGSSGLELLDCRPDTFTDVPFGHFQDFRSCAAPRFHVTLPSRFPARHDTSTSSSPLPVMCRPRATNLSGPLLPSVKGSRGFSSPRRTQILPRDVLCYRSSFSSVIVWYCRLLE